jgi:hypothetical protein
MLETGLRSFCLGLLAAGSPAADASAEAHFLQRHLSPGEAPGRRLARALADPHPSDRTLLRLSGELGLNRMELLAAATAISVETDLMCGRAVAHLQAPVGGSRPTLGLLAAVFAELDPTGSVMAAILNGAGVRSGLLQILNDDAPLAERAVAVPVPLCLALAAGDERRAEAVWPGASFGPEGGHDVLLPPSALAEAQRQARGLSGGVQKALAIRSASPAEARAAASAIAGMLGRRAVFIEPDKGGKPVAAASGLGPWLILRGAMPVYCFELGPGERRQLPAPAHYRGPSLALCGTEGSLEGEGGTVPVWTIGVAPVAERARLWQHALGNPLADDALARTLAARHRHRSGRIAQLGRLAQHRARLDGRTAPTMGDVVGASWTSEGAGLDALAQALPHEIGEDALVMTPSLREELNRLLLRCRGREGLVDRLGASAAAKYYPGVRALFTGPSGTGKTLACGWLAGQLGLPLYRVDLAAVTSKYIGETEKNLARLLGEAEHAEAILLFDEADSMFGKRTDVRESNDRFANAQTNYLLQRIESFDGIVFLTSNSRARFDPAFFRRLDAIVEFPVPGAAERRALWVSHLGAAHLLGQRELNQLSVAADLLGGSIRNAVLTAAVLARAEGRAIGYGDILQSVGDEYRKLGRQLPSELSAAAMNAALP